MFTDGLGAVRRCREQTGRQKALRRGKSDNEREKDIRSPALHDNVVQHSGEVSQFVRDGIRRS